MRFFARRCSAGLVRSIMPLPGEQRAGKARGPGVGAFGPRLLDLGRGSHALQDPGLIVRQICVPNLGRWLKGGSRVSGDERTRSGAI